MEISHSLSDNSFLPPQASNLFGNPLFADPSFFNFTLQLGSPGIQSGYKDDFPVDMGTHIAAADLQPSVMISRFFVNANALDLPEFIALYNPSDARVDLSGYAVTKGVTAILPEGTTIGAGHFLYITDNAESDFWNKMNWIVVQWMEGHLSNNGEAIQLEDSHGIVIDYLVYKDDGFWPVKGFEGENAFDLIRSGLDNHFPESWLTVALDDLVSVSTLSGLEAFSLYPNPTKGQITIKGPDLGNQKLEIYTLSGQLLGEYKLNQHGEATLDLVNYPAGLLIIKAGTRVGKVVLLEH